MVIRRNVEGVTRMVSVESDGRGISPPHHPTLPDYAGADGLGFVSEVMGVGGEFLGRDGEIECRINIRFSELYDLKIRNSSVGKEGKKSF